MADIKITPDTRKIPWGSNPKGKKFFGLKITINIQELIDKIFKNGSKE